MNSTAKLADVLEAEVMGRLMAIVSKGTEELEKDASFQALSVEEQERKKAELRSHAIDRAINGQSTFVHYKRAGWWMDHLIGSVMTVGVGIAAAAVAIKIVGKPAEVVVGETGDHKAEGEAHQAPLFNTGFDKASDRPIRSSRELKAAV